MSTAQANEPVDVLKEWIEEERGQGRVEAGAELQRGRVADGILHGDDRRQAPLHQRGSHAGNTIAVATGALRDRNIRSISNSAGDSGGEPSLSRGTGPPGAG